MNFKDDAWVRFDGDKKFHCLVKEVGTVNTFLYKLCDLNNDHRWGALYEMRRDIEANRKCAKCYQLWLKERDRIMSENQRYKNKEGK